MKYLSGSKEWALSKLILACFGVAENSVLISAHSHYFPVMSANCLPSSALQIFVTLQRCKKPQASKQPTNQQHQNSSVNCLVVQSSPQTPTESRCYHLQTSPVIWAAWASECWTTNLGLCTLFIKLILFYWTTADVCSDCRYDATCGGM